MFKLSNGEQVHNLDYQTSCGYLRANSFNKSVNGQSELTVGNGGIN